MIPPTRPLARRAPPRLLAPALALALALAPAVLAQDARDAGSGPAAPAPTAPEEAPFAALRIEPAGDSSFDLATGVTTLEDGGTVTDQGTGVRLEADLIRYADGAFVEAERAVVAGGFGRVAADRVRIDLAEGTLRAEGGLELEREGLALAAGALDYDAEARVAVFSGGVSGTAPDFEAAALALDAESGLALLAGPYAYRDDLIVLSSDDPEARLELRPAEVDEGLVYSAGSRPSEGALARLEPRLP